MHMPVSYTCMAATFRIAVASALSTLTVGATVDQLDLFLKVQLRAAALRRSRHDR